MGGNCFMSLEFQTGNSDLGFLIVEDEGMDNNH